MKPTVCAVRAVLGAALLLCGSAALRGEDVSAELDAALARIDSGATNEAIASLDALSRRLAAEEGHDQQLAQTYLYLAAAHLAHGDPPRAAAFVREALRLDPAARRHCDRLPSAARALCAGQDVAPPPIPAPPAQPPPPGPARAKSEKRQRGSSTLPLLAVLGSGGAGAASGILLTREKNEVVVTPQGNASDPRDRDDDGDGYTENQGDCDDAHSGVRPRGPVVVSGAFSPLEGQTIGCRTRDSVTVILTNSSCQAVNVQRARLISSVATGLCTSPAVQNLLVAASRVGPGESRAIVNASPASPTTGVGCCRGACFGTSCTLARRVVVETDAGTFEPEGYSIKVNFESCAQCALLGDESLACGSPTLDER